MESGFVLFIHNEFVVVLMVLDGILVDFVFEQRIQVFLLETSKSPQDDWISGDCGVIFGLLPNREYERTKHAEVILH